MSRGKAGTGAWAFATALILSGCMGETTGDVARAADGFENGAEGGAPVQAALDAEMEDGTRSVLIDDLLNRRSVLEAGPLRQVADAVMAANARAAEADLRAARLRAEAQSMNWLPTVGPQVSLNALGAVVTTMMVSQALFDNGRARAERDHARADVEVAAVALAEDSNARVLEALELYLRAEAARARAGVNETGLERMAHFALVMTERVNAGVSDRADLQIVTQKQEQMRADLGADRASVAAAVAELQAMSAAPVDAITGLSPIAAPQPAIAALAVMKAEAEGARTLAAARAARAGFLPGLSVGGAVGSDGNGLGLTLGAPNGIGFGSGAAMRAAAAEGAAADARLGQEREAAARRLAALEGQLASLVQQEAEARVLATRAGENFDLFAAQQRAGQRSVPDVVGVFETRIRAERAAVALRFDIALTRLRIAAHLGTLVDGERI